MKIYTHNEQTETDTAAIAGLAFKEYKEWDAVNFSQLTPFSRSPLDAKRERDGLTARESTEAMELGSALHALVLEGREGFYVRPDTYGAEGKKWNGNANECKAWAEAHQDKPVLSAGAVAKLRATASYVLQHSKAGPLLTGGHPEVSIYADDAESGLSIKGRLDYLQIGPDYVSIIDLKRTQDASTEELAKTIRYRRYHVQAAMYRRLVRACGADAVRYFFVAIEDGQLPKVNVRELNPRAIDLGDEILDADLAKYAECKRSGIWPEWADDGPGVACIDLPEWCYPEPVLTGMTKG